MENKVFLISCVKSKESFQAKASLLYTSTLFKKMLEYATKQKPKEIFILSAQYGLLNLDDLISPYEKTLNNMRLQERKEWSKKVISKLSKVTNLKEDHFVFLAGEKYRQHLLPSLSKYSIPMKGLTFGHQLKWLAENE